LTNHQFPHDVGRLDVGLEEVGFHHHAGFFVGLLVGLFVGLLVGLLVGQDDHQSSFQSSFQGSAIMALSPWLLALSGFPPESSNRETSSFVSNAEEEARRVAMMTKAQR
jgi:hypothetical protein